MGSSPRAHLAYGYDLGTDEDFKAAEVSEYGSPNLPWYDADSDEEEDDDTSFDSAAERILLASVGFTEQWSQAATDNGYYERRADAHRQIGVEFDYSGHADYAGRVLIVKGSGRSVEWSETMTLDPADLAAPRPEWEEKLRAALTALGITPTQDGPKWLVFPSYG